MRRVSFTLILSLSLATGCGGGGGGGKGPTNPGDNQPAPDNGQQTQAKIVFNKNLTTDLSQPAIIMLLDDMVKKSPGWMASINVNGNENVPRYYQYATVFSDLPGANLPETYSPCLKGGKATSEAQGTYNSQDITRGDISFQLQFQDCMDSAELPHYSFESEIRGNLNGTGQWEMTQGENRQFVSLNTSITGSSEELLTVYTKQGSAGYYFNYSDVKSSVTKSSDDQYISLNDSYTVYFEAQLTDKQQQAKPIGGQVTVTTLEPLRYAVGGGLWFPESGKLQIADDDQVAIVEFTGNSTYTVSIDNKTYSMDLQYFGGSAFKGLLIKANMQDLVGVGFANSYKDEWAPNQPVALFENGDASYDFQNVLNPAGKEISKNQYPGDWRQWKKDDSGLYFGTENNWKKLPHSNIKSQKEQGVRLNGTYTYTYYYDDVAVVKSFTFTQDGRFSISGFVSVDYENPYTDGWAGGSFESPREQGFYEIDGFLLTLRFGSGVTTYKTIVHYAEANGNIDLLVMDHLAYIR